MRHASIAVAAGAAGLLASPVFAAEETLNFRLVTRDIVSVTHTDAGIEGLALGAGQSVGVAVFDDGRIAYKEYVYITYEGKNAPGLQPGYSSYVFENGDSLQLSFMAGPGDGGFVVDYTVLSGEGAFAGASGTGRIALVPTTWDGATLFEGSITVVTP